MSALLRLESVSKLYASGEVVVRALDGVSLEVRAGEFMVLLGASGSGKSTLLNLLGGLDTPTQGRVLYTDQDLTRASEQTLTLYRRNRIGFVFQFYNLLPSLTALENVSLVTEQMTEPGSAPLPAEEALARVGLAHRLHHFPAQLSGGEQQRVAIARAIAKRPGVLLCDEPTGALDQRTGEAVLEVLRSVNRDLGSAVVVITHNTALASRADRVVTLADGRIVGEGAQHSLGESRN
jgi:putative ABC transport system ATP-binding protein